MELNILISSIKKRAPSTQHPATITLWGTGNPYHEFLHVDDATDACVFVMNNVGSLELEALSNSFNNEMKNTHINIGLGQDITVRKLAFLIKKITVIKGRVEWDNSKPAGTFSKLLDVPKINSLGWNKIIPLEEGVKMVYSNHQSE